MGQRCRQRSKCAEQKARISRGIHERRFSVPLEAMQRRLGVSGVDFSFVKVGSGKVQRPFAPSLDRIDSAKPYTRDNVRIVIQVANFAINAWGLSPVHQLEGIPRALYS